MNKRLGRLLILSLSLFMLAACLGPKTPQEVTQAFWQAVIASNAEDAVAYSTLTDPKFYDAFSRNWSGYRLTMGKVVIEGSEANIVTTLEGPPNSGADERKLITYLVQREGAWLVDYTRTGNALRGGALGALIGNLGRMGEELTRQLQSSSRNLQSDIDRMGKELEELSSSLSQQASVGIERFAEELRNTIRELEESINRALEENRGLSSKDRRTLKEVAADLERYDAALEQPTAKSVAEGSRNLGRAQQRLDTIDSGAANSYKREWSALAEQIEAEMQRMLDELAASPSETTPRR